MLEGASGTVGRLKGWRALQRVEEVWRPEGTSAAEGCLRG